MFIKADKHGGDVSKVQFFSYEMTIHINMLSPLMKDEIKGNM